MNATEATRAGIYHQSDLELFDKIDDIRSLNSIADLTTLISNSPSDYSYFNFEKLKIHDLPRHLKRVAAQIVTQSNKENKDPSNQSGSTSKSQRVNTARNRKEIPRIEYSDQTDLIKFFKFTKKCIYLCDRTLDKRSEKPIRIETERQYDFNAKEMFQAFEKPSTAQIFSEADQWVNLLVNEEIELGKGPERGGMNDDDDAHLGGMDDDFEIPCTAQTNEPFFSQNGHEFAQSQHVGDINVESCMKPETFGDFQKLESLIQAPLQVNALNIEYAKTSKNIDVRKLKQVIWALLCATDDKVKKLVGR